MEFFNVSEHAVRQARKLKNEKEILATPSNYYREGLDKETKNMLNFMREMSVVCVQVQKDCFSIRNKHGSKEKVQKRFLLANISEIYVNFKAKFPSLKIGFSIFFSCSQNGACLLVLLDTTMCM